MLGLKGAHFFTGATHGEGTGPVYVDELYCSSNDINLSDCRYLFRNMCKHDRDVSVVCNDCGQPDIYYWDVGYFSYNGTTLYVDCSYYRTYIGTLKMTCDNVTKSWVTEGECTEYKFPLDIMDIRLAGGTKPSNGRVELQVMDKWGTVCDNYFGKEEADTVCRMIGYAPAYEVYSGAYFGEGKGPIFIDDLNCLPTASHLNNCTYVTYDNCDHSNDVSVVCTDCGDPTPVNGNINSSETSYGTVVKVSCNDGYLLLGDAVITCQLNNNWTDVPSCTLIDCQDPTPPNGQSNTTDTTNGTVAKITCDTGYNLSGNAIITCQYNQTWTDYPSCNIVDCGMPSPVNAKVTLSENKTTYEEIAVISCNIGYRPDGSTPVTCLANGTWEAWPPCNIIDCGDPTPNNGNRNSTDTIYDSVVSITCDHGLNITGNSTIICQTDGTWSDNPVCDASDCGLLSAPNGKVNASGTTVGSSAYVTCNEGYTLEGSSMVVCTLEGWTSSVSCQKQVNLAMIIGVACGFFILLLVTIIMIRCLRQRNQKKKDELRMQKELTATRDFGKKLENVNKEQQNVYTVLNWQTVADIEDKTDNKSNMYMSLKSIASRFTMSSGSDSKDNGQFHIPRARMRPSPCPNPDYITPRDF